MLAESGRWIYRHRYLVVVVWGIALLAMLPVAPRAQERLLSGGFSNEDFPSAQASKLLNERFDRDPISLLFIVGHERYRPYSPEFDRETLRLIEQIESDPNVSQVRLISDRAGDVVRRWRIGVD